MHKKALTLTLLAASVAALAATDPTGIRKTAPLMLQSAPTAMPAQPVRPLPSQASSASTAQALARWKSLRQTDSLPFSSYASFLTSYRGWPGETAMRKTAERAIDPSSTPPGEVLAFFRVHPPLTTTGHARHAFALLASGQPEEARRAARQAWTGGVLPRTDEDRLLSLFRTALTPADHDLRMETLLDNGDAQSASRTLALASPARRPFYEARLALQAKAPDASARLATLGSAAMQDAGVIKDRAIWLRETGQTLAARNLLAQPRTIVTRPQDAEKWYETLLANARGAANDKQWSMAYGIASQVDDAYPPGTDVSTKSAGERDDYTSLAWLAGTTALHELRRPADAIGMFERYANAARSVQTQSKGFYWAGRAAAAAGQNERANALFAKAAAPDVFYGQLALERLGRPIAAPDAGPRFALASSSENAFDRRDLVEATRLLGQMGQWEDQSLFIRALSEKVESEEERALAGRLALRIGRPDLGVWVARNARNDGESFYEKAGYPQIKVPPAQSNYWALAQAITRQESSFDRAAVSPVGARGMMQLMPPTAREVSGKLGVGYDVSRLTRDPEYNIMLGSSYFASLMDYWDGSVPLAVASYNAGPGNVRKWIRENGDPRLPGADMLKWIEEIPFYETKNYVQRVLENAVVYDLINPNRTPFGQQNRLSYYLGKQRQPG